VEACHSEYRPADTPNPTLSLPLVLSRPFYALALVLLVSLTLFFHSTPQSPNSPFSRRFCRCASNKEAPRLGIPREFFMKVGNPSRRVCLGPPSTSERNEGGMASVTFRRYENTGSCDFYWTTSVTLIDPVSGDSRKSSRSIDNQMDTHTHTHTYTHTHTHTYTEKERARERDTDREC